MIAPSEIDSLLGKAGAFRAQGNLLAAEACLLQILKAEPRQPVALNALGNLAISKRQYEAAIEYHTRAVEIAPRNAAALNDLGNALVLAGEPQRAIPCLQKALKIAPRLRPALFNLARAYRNLNDCEKSLAILRKVEGMAGDEGAHRIDLMLERAVTLSQIGRWDEAAALFRAVLKVRPADPKAIDGLATCHLATPANNDLSYVRAALEAPRLTPLQRGVAHRAAGKILEDLGSYDQAFDHFRQANEVSGVRFDMERHTNFVAGSMRLFTRTFFEERRGFGHLSQQPVFVVGLPRSGTTLVEQILASHPKVAGLGELPDIERSLLKASALPFGSARFLEWIRDAPAATVMKEARSYLATLAARCGPRPRAIDKMPHNLLVLGWIALLFPNARVIHVVRNPLDVCVSCYSHHFSEAHAYSNDLRTLGEYYRSSETLMQHWSATVPLAFLDVRYEDVVENLDRSSRNMIEFLGLEWDSSCLDFHRTARVVQTPSRWQVRQPIYNSSIGRWRRYERHLQPLFDGLQLGQN